MTINDVQEILNATVVTQTPYENNEVLSGFVGDLLSVVMGKAKEQCAWITIQGHINIIAVGTLINVGCIIVTESFKVDDDAVKKANEEDIVIMTTQFSSYEVAALLSKSGLE
ncbi:MAG: AraC family transcriptional regulator [Firmicutes bacterium HGW-Firmicutes-3]|jgi:predicted transcriptional regulator|nr:MAG: AraC family transcriptional regulator [Firmicutes bacterium HGW-Firmicutes-3]